MADQAREQQIGIALAHRAYAYSLMHVVFGGEPNEEAAGKVFSGQSLDVLQAIAREMASQRRASVARRRLGTDAEPSGDGLTLAQCLAGACAVIEGASERADRAALLDELHSDYSRLFLAPGDSYVRQWESSFTGKEGMVFQESTLDVRAFYHDAGFKLQSEKHFPDDHIAAMMDYMGRLGQRAYDAFADGDDDAVRTTLATQLLFVEKHLLNWVDSFAVRVRENDGRGVYAALAEGMAAFVRLDYDVAGEIDTELGA